MSDKPLHVRVAEALTDSEAVHWHWNEANQRPMLGPNPTGKTSGSWALPVLIRDPGFRIEEYAYMLFPAPNYHDDWSATGPLIEKYRLDLWHVPAGILSEDNRWRATCERAEGSEEAETPLIAVCNLILALHAAGKLYE